MAEGPIAHHAAAPAAARSGGRFGIAVYVIVADPHIILTRVQLY